MKVVHGLAAFEAPEAVSLTIGNFDGVHLGHRELLRRTVAGALSGGVPSVALTFVPHPVRFFFPGSRFYEITTLDEKAALIAEAGIDVLVVLRFDGRIGRMEAGEFAREIVAGALKARRVVVGYDFTFGRNRAGTPGLLATLGRSLGFSLDVVPPLLRGGSIVSSSRIRELLLAGRVREAEDLLCRPYRLSGPVVTGAGRGMKLGFPTANVQFVQDLVPLPGVYVVDAEVDGVVRRGVANVGFSPTFGENSLGLEVHLVDFLGDLYGRTMAVAFRERIREEKKFKTVEELARQIGRDVRYAREIVLPPPREAPAAAPFPIAEAEGEEP